MDPLPDGSGFRGWADRLAEILAVLDPELRYANLAVRGKLARQVRAEQLDAALALAARPRAVLSGLNDMLRKNVDVDAVAGEIDAMVGGAARRRARTSCCSRCPTRCRSTRSRSPRRCGWSASTPRSARSRRAAARSWPSSTRTPSPPTGGCGTRTGCTRTRRATSGSRWRPRTRSACRIRTRHGPTSSPIRSGAARARRTRSGSGATSRRG